MQFRKSPVRIVGRRLVGRFFPTRPESRKGVRVLAYHRVRPDADDPRSLPPHLFRCHLEILKEEGWQVIGLGDLLRSLGDGMGLPERAILLTFDDGYADFYEFAAPIIQGEGMTATLFMLAGYIGRCARTYSEADYPKDQFLSAEQLRDLHRAGIEIGSHGLSHVPLAKLPFPEAEREIALSRDLLSDLLGAPVRAFSFPWGRRGDFLPRHILAVAAAGYEVAFTMLHGVNFPPLPRFFLFRCHVYPWDDPKTFRGILEGRFDRWCVKNWLVPRLREPGKPSPMSEGNGGRS